MEKLFVLSDRTADAEGAKITTIEGLDNRGEHPVQKAWLELQVL